MIATPLRQKFKYIRNYTAQSGVCYRATGGIITWLIGEDFA